MSDPGISVVIVSWNGRADLETCLRALERQTDRGFDTIVVDNGSTDGTVEMVSSGFSWVRVIATGKNNGFAEGCNIGIDASRTDWVATLNPDTEADVRWIEALRAAAREAPADVGMLQSKVVLRQSPDRTNSTGVLLFTNGSAEDRDFDRPARPDDAVEEVFCATAGAALYRRAMLDRIALPTGVFDRTFFMYYEDVDLGWRARVAGWSALYVPGAVVKHAFQASSRKRETHFISMHLKRNRVRMILKNGSWAFATRTLPKTLYDLGEAFVWEGFKGIAGVFGAARDGLRGRSEVAGIATARRRDVERRWVVRRPG
jgi:GT2 family glycosyltransferase